MEPTAVKAVPTGQLSSQDSGVQVIGAGFGRTGTLSLKIALQQLGYNPCYHMVDTLSRPEHKEAWGAALAASTTPDLKKLLHGFQATVDWPGCHFYRELMQLYPDAKVILTLRDPEQWWLSAKSTIFSGVNQLAKPAPWYARWLVRPDPMLYGMDQAVLGVMFKGHFREDKEFALQVFQEWNDEVRATVPADRLLVCSVEDGWEPLCTFLGKPVPNTPFPHRNTAKEFREVTLKSSGLQLGLKRRRQMTQLAAVLDVAALGMLAAVAFVGLRWLHSHRAKAV